MTRCMVGCLMVALVLGVCNAAPLWAQDEAPASPPPAAEAAPAEGLTPPEVPGEAARPAAPQIPGDEAAQALMAQVLKAYKETTTYEATTDFELRQKEGRWLRSQKTDFKVAYDRAAGRLLVDKPDLTMVVSDGKLRLKGADLPGRHLEVPAPEPLDFTTLTREYFFIAAPPLPDLVLLTSELPILELTAGNAQAIKALEPRQDDQAKRPGLQVSSGPVTMTLWMDPSSHLVTGMDLDLNAQSRGGLPGDEAVLEYEIKVTMHNAPVAADTFKLDTTGSKSVGSLQELMEDPELGPMIPHGQD